MADDVPPAEKKRRWDALDALQAEIVGAINHERLGEVVEVLVEERHRTTRGAAGEGSLASPDAEERQTEARHDGAFAGAEGSAPVIPLLAAVPAAGGGTGTPTVGTHAASAPPAWRWRGRTRTNKLVFFSAPDAEWRGRLARVRITGAGPWSMIGELVE